MFFDFIGWLHALPPIAIYTAVFFVVGIESIGVPLPGEAILMSAALLASQHIADPWLICIAGASGAIIGDSIGYYVGHKKGDIILKYLGKWYPELVTPKTIKLAKSIFRRRGFEAIFLGRFVAIMRIIAGPLAGTLNMPYRKFVLANATGAIVWATVTVWTVYFLGVVAEKWFHNFSWIALVVILIASVLLSMFFGKRIEAYLESDQAK